MAPGLLHLHTYFLFPFSIDKQAVLRNHAFVWAGKQYWIDGLDDWIAVHGRAPASDFVAQVGGWQRSAYQTFTLDSPAYQDMVFFHPFVRRVFFDTSGTRSDSENLLRCYRIPLEGKKLFYESEDIKGRSASLQVTDLRLFLYANGIGILSLGVEAYKIPASQALWINESMRKVYPSSSRQIREGRFPSRLAFVIEQDGERKTVVEERFRDCTGMIGFLPPLAKTITSLLYFTDYSQQEFEPVLDERMIVYTYAAIDPDTVPANYVSSEEYRVLISRFLYVDRDGADYRYDKNFLLAQMHRQLYRRWAHQGTYYGATSYSNITICLGNFDCDEHELREGFLIHRMFDGRYYLMAIVALFYRVTLLHFAEVSAEVSKQLYLDIQDNKLTLASIKLANDLRSEFLHFANYWYFDELANKEEEIDHFLLQCREYRTDVMKREIEEEVDKLNASLHNFFQLRNTEAVNRLAMLSLIFGAGAVLTGFFGMNFAREFGQLFFEGTMAWWIHYGAVAAVSIFSFGALLFGIYMVISNWADYKSILSPRKTDTNRTRVF
ncbi:MAG: CorA family divalent cation transporter [Bryobacteraceae bacterium]|nr:CorA family divalent cation transporter [Bryobacteraceae bacterium]MDW8378009.1 CorA family divalent cation transporter [Bryobacterales bacterium]